MSCLPFDAAHARRPCCFWRRRYRSTCRRLRAPLGRVPGQAVMADREDVRRVVGSDGFVRKHSQTLSQEAHARTPFFVALSGNRSGSTPESEGGAEPTTPSTLELNRFRHHHTMWQIAQSLFGVVATCVLPARETRLLTAEGAGAPRGARTRSLHTSIPGVPQRSQIALASRVG